MDDPTKRFCLRHGISLVRELGRGREGIVYETTRGTALKVHREDGGYRRERDAYLRLHDLDIQEIHGLTVPSLLNHDDACRILEITLVNPPYLLDFGSAWLDSPPDFPDEHISQWHEEIRDRFGSHFADAMAIVNALAQKAGIHLLDVNPDNIEFEDRHRPFR